ncbi:MAG: hypothetical protein Q9163_001564 [Psora crenata]
MSRTNALQAPTLRNVAQLRTPAVWIIVGASRGIGLEFVRQLIARGDRVYAAIRDPANASQLWALAGAAPMANCELLQCDVADEASIAHLSCADLKPVGRGFADIASSFGLFAEHLVTNTVGPIITAQKLLDTRIPIKTIAFMSSDSGAASDFRHFEDG